MADPRRPKLMQPFFSLSLALSKKLFLFRQSLGGGELFYKAPGQSDTERRLKIMQPGDPRVKNDCKRIRGLHAVYLWRLSEIG